MLDACFFPGVGPSLSLRFCDPLPSGSAHLSPRAPGSSRCHCRRRSPARHQLPEFRYLLVNTILLSFKASDCSFHDFIRKFLWHQSRDSPFLNISTVVILSQISA
jgi:hypothetical protein